MGTDGLVDGELIHQHPRILPDTPPGDHRANGGDRENSCNGIPSAIDGSGIGGSGISDKRALSADGSPDNSSVHLPRVLVGADCFRVGDESSDVVFKQDFVAAEQFRA